MTTSKRLTKSKVAATAILALALTAFVIFMNHPMIPITTQEAGGSGRKTNTA